MDVATLIPVLVALISTGGIALYTARPRKDSIIAEAAERAVAVVGAAIGRLEEENKKARERIAVLESMLVTAAATRRDDLERIDALRREVARLGGDVDRINRVGKRGPAGDQGPTGEKGEPGDHG